MTSLEQQLNTLIEKNGYRISPRLSLEDRLTRFIQMDHEAKHGEWLDTEDARQAARLTMMKYSASAWQRPQRHVEETSDGSLRVTLTRATTGTHSMVRRSHGRTA